MREDERARALRQHVVDLAGAANRGGEGIHRIFGLVRLALVVDDSRGGFGGLLLQFGDTRFESGDFGVFGFEVCGVAGESLVDFGKLLHGEGCGGLVAGKLDGIEGERGAEGREDDC